MEFSILGTLAVRIDGAPVTLGGAKQRALLAMLLLRPNEVVSRDSLVEGLWGERVPTTAQRSLDSHVSRLRRVLGAERIERRAPGYVLRVEPGELDLDRFESLHKQGRTFAQRGDNASAARSLREALALWPGPALADLLFEPFATREAARLEERRLLAFEERIDADLALGEAEGLVAELEQAVGDHPYRERLVGQLMLALYRSGRQSEALAVYQTARQRLAGELGLDPGLKLRDLERRILQHDPALSPSRAKFSAKRGSRRRAVALTCAVIAVAVSAAIGTIIGTASTKASPSSASTNQIVALAANGSPAGHEITLDSAVSAIASDRHSLWLAEPGAGTVSRFDLEREVVVENVHVGGSPGAIAVAGGWVWAASVPGTTVVRIDPKSDTTTEIIHLGDVQVAALAGGAGGLWVADRNNDRLIELDPVTGLRRHTFELPLKPTALALGLGKVWVAGYDSGQVAEVDPKSGSATTISVGHGPSALAFAGGYVWVANSLDSTVSRIDPRAAAVTWTTSVGSDPTTLVSDGRSVFVGNQSSATVSRIDVRSEGPPPATPLGGRPTTMAINGSRVWVTTRALQPHTGGTLILLHNHPISIDPAFQYDLQPGVSDGLTRDGLITFNHADGQAGLQLVADLAIRVPQPTDGGKTYTFQLRPDIRYSDGRLVRASDFRRELERVYRLRSSFGSSYESIAGAPACEKRPTTCNLSRGVVTDDQAGTITFHLNAPDPDFLTELTNGGQATPVPPGTPYHLTGYTPIPGTGPYKIAFANAHEIRYVRNPFFKERSSAAQPAGNPDVIVMRFGLTPKQEVRAIEHGTADWTADSIPSSLVHEVHTRYASQLQTFFNPETDFLQVNTKLPPFNDLRVRQALNLAIDRSHIVKLLGGRSVATATCQIVPPGLPGYRPYCPYPHDRARAEALIAASGTRGTTITVWGWKDDPLLTPSITDYVATVLQQLGYRTRVHLVKHAFLARAPASVFRTVQLIPTGFLDTAAETFFKTWFSCGAVTTAHDWFCRPNIDREIRKAQLLGPTDPRAANALWAAIDHRLADQAASVPLINEAGIDLISARVSNYHNQPGGGLLADQLWLR